MKKVTYLLILMFSLVLVSTSCCKDDPEPDVKTLEQLYPEWKNLTWVSTDGNSLVTTYPKLEISISDNLVTVTKQLTISTSIIGKYTQASISGGTATFANVYQDYNGTGNTLSCTGVVMETTQIRLTCLGNSYVLQIN